MTDDAAELERDWEAFCAWRDGSAVDEVMLLLLRLKMQDQPPGVRLEIASDAYSRGLINKATLRACLDCPA